MSKKIFLLFIFLAFLFIYPHVYNEVQAQAISATPSEISNKDTGSIEIKATNLIPGRSYSIETPVRAGSIALSAEPPNTTGEISFHLCLSGLGGFKFDNDCNGNTNTFQEGTYFIKLYENTPPPFPEHRLLAQTSFKVIVKTAGVIDFLNTNFKTTDDIIIKISDIPDGSYIIRVDGQDPSHKEEITACIDAKDEKGIPQYNLGKYYEGQHNIQIYTNKKDSFHPFCGVGSFITSRTFTVSNTVGGGAGSSVKVGTTNPAGAIIIKSCTNKDPNDPSFDPRFEAVCASGGGKLIEGCNDPSKPGYNPKNPAIATAIGCIHTNPAEFVKDLMKFIIGIGGGIAFLMMLLGAFQMLTSQGNPETLNAGRERLTSAVIGLLFVIFAVLFLQIIGFDILRIPGFGR